MALNQRNKVISCERISMGGVASTLVDVKVVARTAIEHLASAIILVHNHPSGNMKPSAQDDSLTRKIKEGWASYSSTPTRDGCSTLQCCSGDVRHQCGLNTRRKGVSKFIAVR